MKKKQNFHEQLVLNKYVLNIFKGKSLSEIKQALDHDHLQGINDTDGHSFYYHALINNLIDENYMSFEEFSKYDINIMNYWNQITRLRNKTENTKLHLKYFQYLSLLFTEIYLNRFFNNHEKLLNDLNNEVESFNEEKSVKEQYCLYNVNELNKVAYWSATGSGKTLLMHINILQYLHYFESKKEKKFPDKIILLTPNEGLSLQHLKEFNESSFEARLFDKNKSVFPGTIEIIDINKLGDKMGEKVVAVDAFEGDNLVLIDEGHRGTSKGDGAWMSRREALSATGFSFEYSATFGQIASKSITFKEAKEDYLKKKSKVIFGKNTVYSKLSEIQKAQVVLSAEEKRKLNLLSLKEIYGKCILFDYSYKFFYEDGYGKESKILNLQNDLNENDRYSYLIGSLLTFYQQLFLWGANALIQTKYMIEKPLMIFVGNKVNDEDSDILDVIKFLKEFLDNPDKTIKILDSLIKNDSLIVDNKGDNPFNNNFIALSNYQGREIYHLIIEKVFNASSKRDLKLMRLRNSKGEISLQVGNNDPFGVINIGDDLKFAKTIEKYTNLSIETDEFNKSLFESINKENSPINFLIGSKKFTEGWSSWRVSSMGLLNMGKTEGSQIIQLFGRGVRLKGEAYSLKRSTPLEQPKGAFLEKLETLNVFGVKANYIAQFREYLKEENILTADDFVEISIPVLKKEKTKDLKVITLKNDYSTDGAKSFRFNIVFSLFNIPEDLKKSTTISKIVIDLYPKVASLYSLSQNKSNSKVREEIIIPKKLIKGLNFEKIYLELLDKKNIHKIYNMRINEEDLRLFLIENSEWYTLYAPKSIIEVNSYKDLLNLEKIVIQMLESFMIKVYRAVKNSYESSNYEIITLKESKGLWIKNYDLIVENTAESPVLLEKINELNDIVSKNNEKMIIEWSSQFIGNTFSSSHLYQPLLYKKMDTSSTSIDLSPRFFGAPSEIKFVEDLEWYIQKSNKLLNKEVYLLRNADSKQKGFGFAQAGNFYPDFLMWIIDKNNGTQWLSFIDPKGIRNLNINSSKFDLAIELKKIQANLNCTDLHLNAFILSITRFEDLINIPDNLTIQDLENKNILFMNDDRYIQKLMEKVEMV